MAGTSWIKVCKDTDMGAIRAVPVGTRLVPILPREYLPHDRLNSVFPKKSLSTGPPGMLLFGHAANDISTQTARHPPARRRHLATIPPFPSGWDAV